MDPHQAWLVLRASQTLAAARRAGQENAMALAPWLRGASEVAWVRYPGLASHPQHELARRQMDGLRLDDRLRAEGGRRGGPSLMNSVG